MVLSCAVIALHWAGRLVLSLHDNYQRLMIWEMSYHDFLLCWNIPRYPFQHFRHFISVSSETWRRPWTRARRLRAQWPNWLRASTLSFKSSSQPKWLLWNSEKKKSACSKHPKSSLASIAGVKGTWRKASVVGPFQLQIMETMLKRKPPGAAFGPLPETMVDFISRQGPLTFTCLQLLLTSYHLLPLQLSVTRSEYTQI